MRYNIEHFWWDLRRSCHSLKNGMIISLVLLQAVGYILVHAKGAGNIYGDMALFLVGITIMAWVGTTFLHGNYLYLIYSIILFSVGNMLQCIFRAEAVQKNAEYYGSHSATFSLQLQYLMAIAAAMGIAILYRNCERLSSMNACRILTGLSLLISILTLILGHGSVKNWIVIGGISLQTTEITKFLYVLIAAGLLGTTERPSKERIWTFYGISLLQMLILVIQSEFGTLLLIGFIFLIFLFLFVEDFRYVIGTIITGIVGATLIGFLGMQLKKAALAGSVIGTNPFSRFFLSNYNKIANRVIYWLDPEKDALGLGYQLLKAKESIVLGGFFGTSSITDLPVKTSDLVYPALIQRCGMIFAILIFIVYILMYLEGMRLVMRKEDRYHRMVAVGYVSMLFVQAIIIIGGSTGLCPLTGITLPFISSGGTSLMICFMMVSVLLSISGNISWKGTREYEEDEFFKAYAGFAKRNVGVRHSHDSGTYSNISHITRNIRGGRRTKRKSKTADL